MDRPRSLRLVSYGAASALAVGLVGLVPAPAQAATLCQSDCIGTVTAAAGLDQVRFTFATTANTKVSIQIRRADGSGSATTWGGQAAAFTNSYNALFSGLASGVAYRYQIVATDYLGGSWQENGSFATSQRRITVTPSKLTIDDDSDTWSAGDLVGAIHIYDTCMGDIRALSPLSKTSLTQVNSGTTLTVGSGATITCDKVPASVWLETYLADNDVDSGDSCGSWWPWAFAVDTWSSRYGSNTCADWNNGYTKFTFPLAASLPTGSSSASFTHTSTQKTWDGWTLALRWTLTGTVTYSHVKPAIVLPATTTGPMSTQVVATAADSSLNVSWQAVSVPGFTNYGYRISHRPVGGAWASQDVAAGTLSKTLTGLANGTTYEVKVAALDYAKGTYALDDTTATPVASIQPTTISGWSTAPVSLSSGQTVSVPVTVTSLGVPRTVSLESRKQGSATWVPYWSGSTDAAGTVTLQLPVGAGIIEHRLTAAATASLSSLATSSRTLTALTSLTGFATGPTSAPVGSTVPATVTVAPGAGRSLVLVRRESGGLWQIADQLVADGTGTVSFDLPVTAGTTEWAVQAVASADYGSSAATGIRTVTGTAAALTPTVVTGWTTASAILPAGTLVRTPVTVTTTQSVRTLRLQYRLPGTTTWRTQMTMTAEPTGKATVSYRTKVGRVAWRLVVDATSEHAGTVTAARTITARSAITGFSTTSVTRARGTVIRDAIVVKPGSRRTVLVQYRKAGTASWKTYRRVVASSTGTLTVSLKAFAGRYSWRAYVPANATYGTSAVSGRRTVTGR